MGSTHIEDDAREELTAFLSNGQNYAPASGQIVGILKQMTDTMNKDLAEASAAEQAAIKSFNELMVAKEKEVNALTKAIEEKMVRLGKLQVEIVQMKEDLDDTSKSLMEDKKFLADLKKSCATKAEEHAANMKLRSEELLALADTIKILNDDDALELFQKNPSCICESFAIARKCCRSSSAGTSSNSSESSPRAQLHCIGSPGKEGGLQQSH
jgi:hypothetical protein